MGRSAWKDQASEALQQRGEVSTGRFQTSIYLNQSRKEATWRDAPWTSLTGRHDMLFHRRVHTSTPFRSDHLRYGNQRSSNVNSRDPAIPKAHLLNSPWQQPHANPTRRRNNVSLSTTTFHLCNAKAPSRVREVCSMLRSILLARVKVNARVNARALSLHNHHIHSLAP